MESSINQYKLKEQHSLEKIDDYKKKLDKSNSSNKKLCDQLESLQKRLRNLPNMK